MKSITIKTMDSSVSTRMPDGTVKTVSSKVKLFLSFGDFTPKINKIVFLSVFLSAA